jgi:3-hydroxyanthranilate 3,4-dioxygenase
MSIPAPINLHAWIAEHRHLLQPPVGNKAIWNGDYLVMVVGGPNQRSDYHINPGGELFYQVEGDIVLKIMDDGKPRDVPIRQGELFLLPAGVPHSPQRPAGTVGLVVETPKFARGTQYLRWYCRNCGHVLHEAAFEPADIGKQIKTMLADFNDRRELHTCKQCGTVFPAEVPS